MSIDITHITQKSVIFMLGGGVATALFSVFYMKLTGNIACFVQLPDDVLYYDNQGTTHIFAGLQPQSWLVDPSANVNI